MSISDSDGATIRKKSLTDAALRLRSICRLHRGNILSDAAREPLKNGMRASVKRLADRFMRPPGQLDIVGVASPTRMLSRTKSRGRASSKAVSSIETSGSKRFSVAGQIMRLDKTQAGSGKCNAPREAVSFSAKGAAFISSLGQRPRILGTPNPQR
jgi:hypothetical protein